jgi:hypothetical protein
LTAHETTMPRSLLTTSVASASDSTSSAITSSGRPLAFTFSSRGRSFWTEEILFSWTRISGFSNTTSIFWGSFTKCGERKPRSNCMPSTTVTSVSSVLPSSTVMTPSLPTFSIASAISLPVAASLLAEIVATWRISSFFATLRAALSSSPETASAPSRRALFSRAGEAPAVIARNPFVKIASVSSVAVVVPSPATSLVLLATSLTSCAPICS